MYDTEAPKGIRLSAEPEDVESPVATAGGGYFRPNAGVHYDKDGNFRRGIGGLKDLPISKKAAAPKSFIPAGYLHDGHSQPSEELGR